MQLYKAVIRQNWLTKNNRRIIGADPASRQVEYLPAGEKEEKALNWLIEDIYKRQVKQNELLQV